MAKEVYKSGLKKVMLTFTSEEMPQRWVFHQDNDAKHSSSKSENNVHLLEWPSQSQGLKPIENLWKDLKNRLSKENIQSKTEKWQNVQEMCYNNTIL